MIKRIIKQIHVYRSRSIYNDYLYGRNQQVDGFKDKVKFWSCDCIVKETVWSRSEKVDHLVYK